MKTRFIFAALLITLLAGCLGDPYEKYIGYWKKNDTKYPQVLQIYKDGETYLLNHNVFQETDFRGNKKNAVVLKKSENQLSVENGFGSTTLGLSDDNKTLHAANMQYTKISSSEFDKLKSEIEVAKKQKEENKTLCAALNEEYKASKKGVDESELDYAVKGQANTALLSAFKEKAKEIPDCHIGLLW